ncbi:MAG: hypothetical protein MK005_17105 [Alcanivorax sp.]|nr:hypothetical protein [Alcanivorax sp.]
MTDNIVEDALGRVLAYLRLSGVTVGTGTTRAALRLVDETLEAGEDGLLERLMVAIPERFGLDQPEPPMLAPPVHHGSIHYAGRS